MTTGAQFADFTAKRVVGYQDLKDYLSDFLREGQRSFFERVYDRDGTFDYSGAAAPIAITANGNDKFQLTVDRFCTDGSGHFFKTLAALVQGIQFQNTVGIAYHVGLKSAEKPVKVQVNPKTGKPEYTRWEESIGETAAPTAVVDDGDGTMTVTVDSVCEAGVSHAGRKCLVWKVLPADGATTEAVAFEELTVTWDGTNNKIATVAALGQSTISTTAANYKVLLLGPTVRRNTNLETTDGYAYVGTVTGVGAGGPPVAFSTAAQRVFQVDLSDVGTVFRRDGGTGDIKLRVKANAADVDARQIEVQDSAGNPVFTVDEDGDVRIYGTLRVDGTGEQYITETVYGDQIVTDSLQAGDADADAHVIKGEWTHTVLTGALGTKFAIDGDTGRVGIGGTYDGTHALKVTGDMLVTGDFEVTGSTTYAAHLLPAADDTYDLGAGATEWRNLYIDGTAYIDTLEVHVGVATDLLPTGSTGNRDLGGGANKWEKLYLDDAAGMGAATNVVPAADSTHNLGSGTYRWATVYGDTADATVLVVGTGGSQGVGSSLIPTADNTYALGSQSVRWSNLWAATGNVYNASGNTTFTVETDSTAVDGYARVVLNASLNGSQIIAYTSEHSSFPDGMAVQAAGSLRLQCGFGYNVIVTGGAGVALLPNADSQYYIGSDAVRWLNIYTDGVVTTGLTATAATVNTIGIAAGAGNGATSNWIPSADSSYTLGTGTYRWSNVYTDDIDTPAATITVLTIQNIDIPVSGGAYGVTSDWYPATDDAYDCGTSTKAWRELFATKITTSGFDSNASPSTDLGFSLGTNLKRWLQLYVQNIDMSAGWLSDCDPSTGNTRDLGDATLYWRKAYIGDLFYKTQATFDHLDDLAELERAFEPAAEANEAGDFPPRPESIPAFMRSEDVSEDGTPFVAASKGFSFLVGASKALLKELRSTQAALAKVTGRLEKLEAAVAC